MMLPGLCQPATAQNTTLKTEPGIQYFGKDHFAIEGTAFPDSVKESPYDRLPAAYKDKVRKDVWDLSKNAAGISIRFFTNSSRIRVRWELLNNASMNHMAPSGIKGIDLYVRQQNEWRFVNTARPDGKSSSAVLVKNRQPQMQEFKMFLPLYDGVTDIEIGIDSAGTITKPADIPQKPIVFYGTSITQGGCASRPGMAFTNIISRKLDRECINFGFSGNGRMESVIGEVISNIDASCFIIDCVPNMKAEQIRDSTEPLIRIIRQKHPETPVILAEGIMYENAFMETGLQKELEEKNRMLYEAYHRLVKNGDRHLYYMKAGAAIGADHEGTVDGVHFTDLGFMRYADFLIRQLKEAGLYRQLSRKG